MKWWQQGVFYQIYPRSFQDSNGDGIGDLAGITARLDHLAWLGVDALWLSPIYPSPMADFGYDIADFTDIDPRFGTLEDFDRLVSRAHKLGLRVLLDYVPNHSSDQHPWFQESRSARDNPRRDWYVWADPAPDGGPPNNWLAYFEGPAWTFDEPTGQYYLHSFLPQQPDLNWRNPDLKRAMLDVLHFWLERGVDGFRVDAVQFVGKDELLRDEPPNPDFDPARHDPKFALQPIYSENQPGGFEVLHAMRGVLDDYGDTYAIGEVPSYFTLAELAAYCAPDALHMGFNFKPFYMPFTAQSLRAHLDEYDRALPSTIQPNYVLGNHDIDRIADRIGRQNLRLAAMLLLTLRGTPYIYYGEEIGMHNVSVPADQIQDPFGKNPQGRNRDLERTPMQWDTGSYAGFSTVKPWLPIADDSDRINVEAEKADTTSLLSLYRLLLRQRKASPALHGGTFRTLDTSDPDCLAYLREAPDQRMLIVLNFADEERVVNLPPLGEGQIVASTLFDRAERAELHSVFLRPKEGCIFELLAGDARGDLN